MEKETRKTNDDAMAQKADLMNSTPSTGMKRDSLLRKIMIWVALEAGVLLIGAAMVFFWLYQPAIGKLNTAQQDLERADRDLSTTQSELDTAQAEILDKQNEITKLEATLIEKEQLLQQKAQNELVLKSLAEANIAQNAFASADFTTVRIALANVKEYLGQLQAGNLDPAMLDGILQRTIQAQVAVENQSEFTGSELDSLVLNLNQLLNLISSGQ
jgi:septal ring factor EnvC (AmiA/AmiB activator)